MQPFNREYSTKELPQYRRLYEILRRHIIEGVYESGDVLPSEKELCMTYHMARPTVRHALANLVRDGFIIKRKGKGSIVYKHPKGVGILSVAGTTTALEGMDLKTRIITRPRIQEWPDPFIFQLSDIEKESGCIYMERLRLVNGRPLFFDITYIPNINLPRFCTRSFENKSLFDTLRRFYNIEIRGGEQRLKAITAEGRFARYLEVKDQSPVLHLERKILTSRYHFQFYSSLYCNTTEHDLFGIF